jgi:hypothetical protein
VSPKDLVSFNITLYFESRKSDGVNHIDFKNEDSMADGCGYSATA